MWRNRYQRKALKVCECEHPPMTHRFGGCIVVGCKCKKYLAKVRPNKYRAKKTEYQGIYYDSGLEAKVASDLSYQLASKTIKKIERQVEFPLVVNGHKICTYIADFLVTHLDGTKEVVEVKGMRLPVFNLKWRLMEALNPKLKLTLQRGR